MALPPQAVERLVQEPTNTQGAYKELVFLSGALLALMLMLYVGIAFGYQSYLDNSIKKLNDDIQANSNQIPLDQQQATANFYSQLVNLKQLLAGHTVVSPVFALLERSADQNIYYTKLNVNSATNEADVAGAAKNITDVAREAALLENADGVDRVNFQNAGFQNGVWQFTMSIFFKPNVLHANGASSPLLNNPPAASSTQPVLTTGNSTTTGVSSTTTKPESR